MNQTNILVVVSSVAAILTLGVVTLSQWVAPWVPLSVGLGWLLLWGVAWVVLKATGEVDVPESPAEAAPALAGLLLVPIVGIVWLLSPVRAAVAPFALATAPDAVEAVINDSSNSVRLAGCQSASDVDPAQWTEIADALAARPDLVIQCAPALTPGLVAAIADRWATALNRPNMDQASACMLTEKLTQLREGKPEVLTRDLMRCADTARTDAARACCEKTFDEAVEPTALLDAGTPTPKVLASFIRVQFKPGKPLNEELAGRLLDATCAEPESSVTTSAYLPYVRETCGAQQSGWIEAYGEQMWVSACAEHLPYFRQERNMSLDRAFCEGMEKAAVAEAVEAAKVTVGRGRSEGRAKEGVAPGVLRQVAMTARSRGGGTSGAGIEESKKRGMLPSSWVVRKKGGVAPIRGDEYDPTAECQKRLKGVAGGDLDKVVQEHEELGSWEGTTGEDPCNLDPEAVKRLSEVLNESDIETKKEDDEKMEAGEFVDERIDAEALMRKSSNKQSASEVLNNLRNEKYD